MSRNGPSSDADKLPADKVPVLAIGIAPAYLTAKNDRCPLHTVNLQRGNRMRRKRDVGDDSNTLRREILGKCIQCGTVGLVNLNGTSERLARLRPTFSETRTLNLHQQPVDFLLHCVTVPILWLTAC